MDRNSTTNVFDFCAVIGTIILTFKNITTPSLTQNLVFESPIPDWSITDQKNQNHLLFLIQVHTFSPKMKNEEEAKRDFKGNAIENTRATQSPAPLPLSVSAVSQFELESIRGSNISSLSSASSASSQRLDQIENEDSPEAIKSENRGVDKASVISTGTDATTQNIKTIQNKKVKSDNNRKKIATQQGGPTQLTVTVKSKKFKFGTDKSKIAPTVGPDSVSIRKPSIEEIEVKVDPGIVETTASGLEILESADQVYIIRKKEKLPFPHDEPTRSHFKILNGLGEHIFTAAQVDFEFRFRKFVMDLYSTDGIPILMIVQRSVDGFRSLSIDWEHMMEYYSKDENLPTSVPYVNRSGFIAYVFQTFDNRVTLFEAMSKEKHPQPNVHIRHADGKFLGHIWRGIKSWIIYDSSIGPTFVFQEMHCNRPIGVFSDTPRHKIWWGWAKRLFSYYEYYSVPAPPRSTQDYLIDSPLGVIEANIDLNHIGIDTKSQDCFAASFPQHLTNVEKALVVGMLLSLYCRTTYSTRCKMLFYGLISLAVFVGIVVTMSISICFAIYGEFCG